MSRRDSIDFYVIQKIDKQDEPANSELDENEKNDIKQIQQPNFIIANVNTNSNNNNNSNFRVIDKLQQSTEIQTQDINLQFNQSQQMKKANIKELKSILIDPNSAKKYKEGTDQQASKTITGKLRPKITFQEEIIIYKYEKQPYEDQEIDYECSYNGDNNDSDDDESDNDDSQNCDNQEIYDQPNIIQVEYQYNNNNQPQIQSYNQTQNQNQNQNGSSQQIKCQVSQFNTKNKKELDGSSQKTKCTCIIF
eukprot:TRINITY_DN12974_c0_g1_i1.p1 TRINITY_DN12974_c0_g1~~TRINITY_DN12974_c0_g1_i1.p1  ORF type:complete len:250 (-),score=57.86 TRINITY_DN12974_c0_g1_i1:168-917(-)